MLTCRPTQPAVATGSSAGTILDEDGAVSQAAKRSGASGSIALLAALVLFAVTAAAVYAAAVFAARNDDTAFIRRVYGHTERTLKAAIDPRFQTKAEEIGRVITRLVVIDAVKGGALFDASGHLQQAFGERTDTSYETVEHTGAKIFRVDDPGRAEFYLSPETTGTPFHLLVRVDVEAMSGLDGMARDRMVVLALAGGVGAAVGAALFIFLAVALPVRRILRVVDKMLANPALADVGDPLRVGRTEVGVLAGGVERFRSSLAELWRTKVMVADAILEASPFAVVQLASDGSVIFGNPAATALFEREVVHTQNGAPLVVRDVDTGGRAVLREHLDVHGGAPRLVEIPTAGGGNHAVVASLVVGAETRTPTTVVMFADVADVQKARLDSESALVLEQRRVVGLARRALEMRLMLESCLTLMAGPDKEAEAHLDITPFADEWIAMAEEGHLVVTGAVSKDGPMIAGPKEDLRAVMRLGLLVACTRCPTLPASVVVDVKGINFETAGLTIKAAPAGDAGDASRPTADWQLALAALRTAVRKVNGQLTELNAGEDGATLKFVLRGAAERLTTGIAASGRGGR